MPYLIDNGPTLNGFLLIYISIEPGDFNTKINDEEGFQLTKKIDIDPSAALSEDHDIFFNYSAILAGTCVNPR